MSDDAGRRGEIGIRKGLKIPPPSGDAGSSPAAGTSAHAGCVTPAHAPEPRVHTLPMFRLTSVSGSPGPGFQPVDHWYGCRQVKYWRVVSSSSATRSTSFAKLPLVLNRGGSPWVPACMWLIERARAKPLATASLKPLAQDLAAYRAYLDEWALEWDDFSSVDKYLRPTYLFNTHLRELVSSRALAPSTAKRRMSTVIAFYRFLMTDPRVHFEPAYPPWVDKGVGIQYRDDRGFKQVAEVITTDVSIKVAKRDDAWDGTIDDGGKLRPLSVEEQRQLIEALRRLNNVEYNLMHWTAMLCGAREMTVLTMRVRCFERPSLEIPQWPYKLRCGPGTGIDTKRDVSGVYVAIPRELYEMLHAYAVSERARKRRSKSGLREDSSNYLFLTNQGQPYYESKEDRNADRDASMPLRRSARDGRVLRKFIEQAVIPEVRKFLPHFRYRFHDLRATFGMNWVDDFMRTNEVSNGQGYVWARDHLRRLLWHKSGLTTDRYLKYRQHTHQLECAQEGWGRHLLELLQVR